MIYVKKKNLHRCLGLSQAMDTAIRHLQSTDLTTLAQGRNEIDGDTVFVNCFAYETMPQEQAFWEGHIQYADIHVVISGKEKIGVANVDTLKQTAVKPEEDFIGYEGSAETWLSMTPGDALIVFPEDAHMVKVNDGETSQVQKACYKVKV